MLAGSTGRAVVWTNDHDERAFNTDFRLTSPDSRLLLDIKNLTCITYDAAIPASSLERKPGPEPFSMISWKPNLKILEPDVFERIWPSVSSSVGRLGKLMELVCHRQHVSKILICGSPAPESVELALSVLPKTASNTLGLDGEQELHLSEEAKARTCINAFPESPEDWMQATNRPHDLVLVDYSGQQPSRLSEALVSLVKNGGWLLAFRSNSPHFRVIPCT